MLKKLPMLLIVVISNCMTLASQARADTSEIVSALLAICVGGGSEQKLEARAKSTWRSHLRSFGPAISVGAAVLPELVPVV